MPAPKFWAYVRMMPVIKARSAIARINEMSLASGNMDKETSSSYIMGLQVASDLHYGQVDRGTVVKPSSPEELAMLSGGAIKVVME